MPATRAPASAEPSWDWMALRREALGQVRRVLDPEQAEDAVQEAMIRAWRGRHRCRSPGAPEPWLRRIAHNEALRLRARSNGREELGADGLEDRSRGGEEALEDRLLRRMSVGEVLQTLAPEDRRLVVLRYVSDLRQCEIAAILGIPEATVRVRLHRIRKRLGALIAERI